jgi:hypothetical protein
MTRFAKLAGDVALAVVARGEHRLDLAERGSGDALWTSANAATSSCGRQACFGVPRELTETKTLKRREASARRTE